ncbi:MAG: heat-inducible transcriptional repressor HrcA [Alphaproteobacteria bacterium]|nr:heat-inducible transcriptional repressor HrcA [Alphaproteobacteria bacterium]
MNTHVFEELDDRARAVFQQVIECFMTDGNPVGSRTLSRSISASPATIRNVMSDLEYLGLLQAPHTSAGRLPTDLGLRYFVDGILEKGSLSATERAALDQEYSDKNLSSDTLLEKASAALSGLSASAGLVVVPKQIDIAIRHIEFVSLSPQKTMVILVSADGTVENRILEHDSGITSEMLRQAGIFLSEKLHGRTISQMRDSILEEIKVRKNELAPLITKVIEEGLASQLNNGKLIVRGHSQLLKNPKALNDIDRLQTLMEQLESQEVVSKLLKSASEAEGVKIYIGSENSIFEGSGTSLILSPYHNASQQIIGAIGVIGPTHLNYAKIIPSVNYMAEILSRRLNGLG